MKKKIKCAVLSLVCLVVVLFCATACGGNLKSEPPYCGAYFSGYPNDADTSQLIIDDERVSSGTSQYNYTYADGTITLSSGATIKIAENNQVAYFTTTLMASHGDITVRNGYFSADFTIVYDMSETKYTFKSDGTFEFVNLWNPNSISGTYSLKNGVLSMVNKYASASLSYLDKLHFWYIDENLNIYGGALVKDYTQFSSDGSGVPNVPDDPNRPNEQSYTVTWRNDDGTVLEVDNNVKESTMPTYDGDIPTKEPQSENFEYVFCGWSPEVSSVTDHVTYVACFALKQLYTVTWENYDYTVLEVDKRLEYGTMPKYDGETPTRPSLYGCKYTFSGWSPSIKAVTSSVTYVAQFDEEYEYRYYTVTWQNYDGTVLEKDENVREGTTPTYDGEIPTRATDDEYEYTFSGWSPSMSAVHDDIIYTAQFTKKRVYTVTWENYDGTVLEIDKRVKYNATPTYDGETPTRATDDEYEYAFSGWSPSVSAVRDDITYTAQYEKEYYIPNLPQHTTPILETPDYSFEGAGTAESPYFIKTSAQLLGMEKFSDKYFALANDIVLSLNDESRPNFKPLFSDENPFNGTLDGKGFSIKNLVLYNTETYYTGLFACVGASGKVENINLENVIIFGANYIGGIAGLSYGAITDCSVNGKITYVPSNSYNAVVGGIVGRLENRLEKCNTDVEIKVLSCNGDCCVGGIVGYMYLYDSTITISDCYAIGSITVKTTTKDNDLYAGGLIGKGYNSYNSAIMKNSYNAGNITVKAKGLYDVYIGGLVGYGQVDFENSNNTGDIVVAASSVDCIGGLLGGDNNGSVDITNSYNIGDISATCNVGYVGGLVGDTHTLSITCAYNLGHITVVNNDSGGRLGGLIGYCVYRGITNSFNMGDINATSGIIGGLIGYHDSNNDSRLITNSYNTGAIEATSGTVGGLIGHGEGCIESSYNIGSVVVLSGTAGGLVGYGGVTLTNCHWLYDEDNLPVNAVGYNSDMGVPTNIGATKHTDISDFYTLADKLNEGLDEPIWENKTESSLPTLIVKDDTL